MSFITFGIIGAGWRAEFYLRIAQALPRQFRVHTMLVRDKDKALAMEQKWGVHTVGSVEQFVAEAQKHFQFAVVSVPRTAAPAIIEELAVQGIPVLAETPPASDLNSLTALLESIPRTAKVEVAEQYLYQPMHAARIHLARSGKLGEISHVQVSAAHDYHGISLIRQLLGIGNEPAVIQGERFTAPMMRSGGRDGDPSDGKMISSEQTIATLRFGDKLAVYDFTREQYFSWIRRDRILVRGSKGEIVGTEAAYMLDYTTPIYTELRRVDTGHNGNLEGYYHRGIIAGDEWLYRNPFAPARLTDDEIAVATSLLHMGQYAAHMRPSFYSLAEASQDHYLALTMQKAVATGQTVTCSKQPNL
ncbi:Gfo/Idh/MocA family protein [Paenibacillus harenae]|uniref:Gfo/Idh/MocA family protein n=1 Tax=Paenibacillus harenae TaxID=306543 RepID=UPI00278F8F7D|nr:Gfo/Idh/MocA family oxidoreductase [Paenibacillus harenae]MDQ0063482.1 putative dehydrogenase [Paenibacillus harenae]